MRHGPRSTLVPLVALLAACGGDRGSGPSDVGSRSRLESGSTLTLVSGETGAPVAGASVTIGAQTLTSDASGQVRLSSDAPLGASIDIVHPAYLDRQSTVRTGTASRFALWPRANGSGLSEHYTATIVYTAVADPPAPTGGDALARLPRGTATVVIVPSSEVLADVLAMDAHQRAVSAIVEATGGAVSYTLAASRPASGLVVTTRVDPDASRCREGDVRGYTRSTYEGLELRSAEIVFCDVNVSRSSTVGHELGHTFGLRHSPDDRDLMFQRFVPGRATTFGPRESLVMRLMLDRPPGNRFPDNDRGAVFTSSATERVVICR
jgi:hypothetical protein